MTVPKRQQAIIITTGGGPEVLQFHEVTVPIPGPQQVLIKVSAAGVNRHDCNQRSAGHHPDGNSVPGLEVAGEIVAMGHAVSNLKLGAPVIALVQGGGYAEYAVADVAVVMAWPKELSAEEAAALPEALFTAWWNFFGLMKLRPGQIGFIHGGTSGVGHLALQALSGLGYDVFASCGDTRKVAAAEEFGARAAFNYHDPELALKVNAATANRGIDALLDMSAGAHLLTDMQMMAPDGRIAHLSGGGGTSLNVPLKTLMAKRISITGSLLRPLPLDRKAQVAALIQRDVMPLIGGRVVPRISAIYPLSDAAGAHREMERGRHIGKIMLRVGNLAATQTQ